MSVPFEPAHDGEAVPEAVHGGVSPRDLARRGLEAGTVLDFSTNVNPFGPSPAVVEAIRRVPLGEYPDRDCTLLRRAISRKFCVAPDRILCGNGSGELLHLIALAFLRPGDSALVLEPTYGEYRRTALLTGARVVLCVATAETGFAIDVEQVARSLCESACRVCNVCTPNNPTGRTIPQDVVLDWARTHPETLFVVDESYIDFVPQATSLIACEASNVLVLRSLTKAHGLAGLRLGYAVACSSVIAQLQRLRVPWNVNSLAQAAGIAALEDDDHVQQSLRKLTDGKRQLVDRLLSLRIECVDSETPFFLADVGDARGVTERLLARGLAVRDATSFGLPAHVRISPRSSVDNTALLHGISAVRAESRKGIA